MKMYLKRRDKLFLLNQKEEFCFTLSAIKTKCPFYIGNLLCFTFITNVRDFRSSYAKLMLTLDGLWFNSSKEKRLQNKKWKFSLQSTKLPGVAFFALKRW